MVNCKLPFLDPVSKDFGSRGGSVFMLRPGTLYHWASRRNALYAERGAGRVARVTVALSLQKNEEKQAAATQLRSSVRKSRDQFFADQGGDRKSRMSLSRHWKTPPPSTMATPRTLPSKSPAPLTIQADRESEDSEGIISRYNSNVKLC